MRTKKLKKLTALAMAATMMTALMTGCGSTEASQGDTDFTTLSQVDFENPVNNTDKVFSLLSSWPKPPLYQGNPYASGGIGTYVDTFIADRLFDFFRLTDEIVPRLAISTENVGNQTIIKIKDDVKWHDGEKFTSKDVWAFYMLNHNKASVTNHLASIETPDDYTIVFNWLDPAPFDDLKIKYIAQDCQGLVPYHIYKEYVDKIAAVYEKAPKATADTDKKDKGPFGIRYTDEIRAELDGLSGELSQFTPEKPIGTGPFKFDSVTETDLVLTKNEDYWRASDIKFEKIHMKQVPDRSAQLAMLKSGAVDTYDGTPSIDILEQMLQSNKDLIHYKVIDPAGFGIILNTEAEPFDDVNVRRAVAYVLDREKIKDVANPYGTPYEKYSSLGILHSSVETAVTEEGRAKMTDFTHNLEKAEEILKEAGWTRGTDGIWLDENGVKPDVTIGTTPDWTVMSQIAAEQLTAFGIPTQVLSQDSSIYYEARSEGKYTAAADFIDVTWSWADPYFSLTNQWNNLKYNARLPKDDNNTLTLEMPGVDGKLEDVQDMLIEYPYADEARRQEIVDDIVYISNENVYAIGFYQGVTGGFINTKNVGGNLPLLDQVSDLDRNMVPVTSPDDLWKDVTRGQNYFYGVITGELGPR